MSKSGLKRKRIIVFGFEGKNNKTETNYFSHFKPKNDQYILKLISCGVTDIKNMISSIKSKRKDLDYNTRDDLTFLFVDADSDPKKLQEIDYYQKKQQKDFVIVKSNPCFELWFLNHFCYKTKSYSNAKELIEDLKKYIPDYEKSHDYFLMIQDKTDIAIKNSASQKADKSCITITDVAEIISKYLKR